MMLALYAIGSTGALLWLSARLRQARDELARVRGDCDDRDRAVRDEYSAYTHGVAMSLACLLAGLAAASWYPPPRPQTCPAGSGRAGARQGAAAGGEAAG